jgi:hypothetical protein
MFEVQGTKLTDDLGRDTIEYIRNRLKEKIERGGKPGSKYQGADVYTFGDMGSGYVVLTRGTDVLYFVRYEKIRHNNLPLGRQVLVWRTSGDASTALFAQTIFFQVLLPKFTALISYKLQTRNGMGFWQIAIKKAFEENMHVYYLDRRSSPNRLITLTNYDDVIQYQKEIWGSDEGHKRTFAVISLKPLKLKE